MQTIHVGMKVLFVEKEEYTNVFIFNLLEMNQENISPEEANMFLIYSVVCSSSFVDVSFAVDIASFNSCNFSFI